MLLSFKRNCALCRTCKETTSAASIKAKRVALKGWCAPVACKTRTGRVVFGAGKGCRSMFFAVLPLYTLELGSCCLCQSVLAKALSSVAGVEKGKSFPTAVRPGVAEVKRRALAYNRSEEVYSCTQKILPSVAKSVLAKCSLASSSRGVRSLYRTEKWPMSRCRTSAARARAAACRAVLWKV